METPKLKSGNCSLLIVEYSTGIICKKDLTYYFDGENENNPFEVFNNVTDAKEYALNFAAVNPKFECSIYNHSGEYLFTCDMNGERKYP